MWQAIILSALPIFEVRGGIPLGIAQGHPIWLVYVTCVLANILVVPIVYFFLEVIHHRFMHYGAYQSLFDKFMERTRRKVHNKVERWGVWGLTLFVAVPLPVTGAYTGTLAAWFFGMDKKHTLIAITIGILISGAITTAVAIGALSLGGWM
ncbi:MAG: small multi-drug export protein [Candidatus Woesearchaeota archaeon]|jgi:uncharacterized membrane protein|nr:small multi-drug export protein [Candidatus Woesearchaeota archaeon]MDP7181655.1 small multi-drug export protein [Candidatus Woesearchaeota archaeon]MDP7198744.1 small multi-drug export protein [Candidatus Woesearchaeota archaeon]MDP7467256.1 small multi-drug export protein [Candidatus Woesearchaeota archaeon]MDP7647409.1 small multi-drug export protein [Candidatus Woesearchaeota archaeon]